MTATTAFMPTCSLFDGEVRCIDVPAPQQVAMEGIRWGRPEEIFSPAFWKVQSWFAAESGVTHSFRLGANLREELAACLLGGYGIRAEVGLAAFEAVRGAGLLRSGASPTAKAFEEVLCRPLSVHGVTLQYRFPRQKARYLQEALEFVDCSPGGWGSGRILRDALLAIPGVGFKTASWVARNTLAADDIAIIDVHVHRAGTLLGLFGPTDDPSRCYLRMEDSFLRFARAIGVAASVLDAVIWKEMRDLSPWLRRTRLAF